MKRSILCKRAGGLALGLLLTLSPWAAPGAPTAQAGQALDHHPFRAGTADRHSWRHSPANCLRTRSLHPGRVCAAPRGFRLQGRASFDGKKLVLRSTPQADARALVDIELSQAAGGRSLVVVTRADVERKGQERDHGLSSGDPYVFGYILKRQDGQERIITYLNAETLKFRGDGHERDLLFTVVRIPEGAERIRLVFGQAEVACRPTKGARATFWDMGAFVVTHRDRAHLILDRYGHDGNRVAP